MKKAITPLQGHVGHADETHEMDDIRKHHSHHSRDVLIVIRSRGKPRPGVLASFVDLWLARELAQQIAKDIMAPEVLCRTRAKIKPGFS